MAVAGGTKRCSLDIDPDHLDRRAAYKLLISAVVPRPIAFVSTISPEGRTNVAPFSFFNGVSSHPPVLMIAVGSRRTGRKDTWNNIEATGEFVVNLVVPEIVDAMVLASGEYPPEVDEIEMTGLTKVPSVRVRPPRIGESPVQMECRLEKLVEVASTALILGRVLLFHVRDDLMEGGRIDPQKLQPVARLGDDLFTRLGEIFERKRPW
jgi:flavin reductase (DIM6/NTAB) family NADH-FMN oxidoreductase RutF